MIYCEFFHIPWSQWEATSGPDVTQEDENSPETPREDPEAVQAAESAEVQNSYESKETQLWLKAPLKYHSRSKYSPLKTASHLVLSWNFVNRMEVTKALKNPKAMLQVGLLQLWLASLWLAGLARCASFSDNSLSSRSKQCGQWRKWPGRDVNWDEMGVVWLLHLPFNKRWCPFEWMVGVIASTFSWTIHIYKIT